MADQFLVLISSCDVQVSYLLRRDFELSTFHSCLPQYELKTSYDTCNSHVWLFILAQSSVEADKLFDDVVDEFASISLIKSRLEMWKFQFPQSYQQAYISLCLPKVFLPFVKLQLLTWNPLEVTGVYSGYLN